MEEKRKAFLFPFPAEYNNKIVKYTSCGLHYYGIIKLPNRIIWLSSNNVSYNSTLPRYAAYNQGDLAPDNKVSYHEILE
jgi:hypothetical protein